MSNFTDYEKHHIHDYVVKNDELNAVKTQIDTEKATKNELQSLQSTISSQVQQDMAQFRTQLIKAVDEYFNAQVSLRIGRKSGTIPKTNQKWIKILGKDDIKGITTLKEIIVTNTYINRSDRYHHAKSDLVASSFGQLEFFFDSTFENYYCYFNSYPSGWKMDYFVEYILTKPPDNNEEKE